MSKARQLADFISDSTVETAELADNAVTSAKLDETDSYTVAGLTVNSGATDLAATFQSTDAGVVLNLTDDTTTLQFGNNAGTFQVYGNVSTFPKLLSASESAFVINDDSNDIDFRVESDGNTHMLFVDAANDSVTIGSSSGLDSESPTVRAANRAVFGAVVSTQSLYSNNCYYKGTWNTIEAANWSAVRGNSGRLSIHAGDSSTAGANISTEMDGVGEKMRATSSGVVFNENGGDNDFRVESDTNTHALFVDGGSSEVGINNNTPEAALHVKTTATNVALLDSSNATGSQVFIRNSNAVTGTWTSLGFAPANNISGAYIMVTAQEDFSGSLARTANMEFYTRKDGTYRNRLYLDSTEAVFNEDSTDTDFRVESGSSGYAIFVDGDRDSLHTFNGADANFVSGDVTRKYRHQGSFLIGYANGGYNNYVGGPYMLSADGFSPEESVTSLGYGDGGEDANTNSIFPSDNGIAFVMVFCRSDANPGSVGTMLLSVLKPRGTAIKLDVINTHTHGITTLTAAVNATTNQIDITHDSDTAVTWTVFGAN